MTPLCQVLPWDSEFFGFRVARINRDRLTPGELNEVLSWCHQEQIRCLYFLCAADQIETVNQIESEQFHFVDARMDFNWIPVEPTTQSCPCDGDLQIRLATLNDLPELFAIVDQRFDDSRFFADQNFPRDKSNSLFLRWIENDVRGCGRADKVWVAVAEDTIVGFATVDRTNNDTTRLGLIAAARPGGGIGSKLVAQVQDHSRATGAKKLFVGTQLRNIRAQRLYQRCGFRTCEVGLWYHRWFAN